jgi:phage shock protein PspC (stress-responsive transcriptional regulator)
MAAPCFSITSPNHHGRHEMDVELIANISLIVFLLTAGASVVFLALMLYFIALFIINEGE